MNWLQFSGSSSIVSSSGGSTNFWTLSASNLYPVSTTYVIMGGLTTTDASPGSGGFVSTGSFISVTASANASTTQISSSGGVSSLIAGKTGTGTYLPLTFSVNGSEQMRVLTSGPFLLHHTADDGSGMAFQNQGGISLTGNTGGNYLGRLWLNTDTTQGQTAGSPGVAGPGTDNTQVDNNGFEGNFFRVKSHLDYFDWTSWCPILASGPIASHLLQLRDSSSMSLMSYFAGGGTNTEITFTDLVINASNNKEISSAAHPFQYWDIGKTVVVTGGTGFTIGSYIINQVDSSNNAFLNNAVGTVGSTGGTGSKTYSNGTFYITGGITASTALYLNANSSSPASPSGGMSGYGGIGYNTGSNYWYWNGSAWTTVDLSSIGNWTRSTGLLYPTNNTDKVLVNRSTDDTSGAVLQVNGIISTSAGNGLLIGTNTNSGSGFIAQIVGGVEIRGTSNSLYLSATGQRILADMTNATVSNRLFFQTSTANSTTTVNAMPSGTGTVAAFIAADGSDPNNAALGQFLIQHASGLYIQTTVTGTGTNLPIFVRPGLTQAASFLTSGVVLVGSSTTDDGTGKLLQVQGEINVHGIAGANSVHYISSAASFSSFLELGPPSNPVEISGRSNGDLMVGFFGVVGNVLSITRSGAIANTLVIQSGSVGIRTNSPTQDLHIKQSSNSQASGGIRLVRSDTSDFGTLLFGSDNNLYLFGNSNGTYVFMSPGTSDGAGNTYGLLNHVSGVLVQTTNDGSGNLIQVAGGIEVSGSGHAFNAASGVLNGVASVTNLQMYSDGTVCTIDSNRNGGHAFPDLTFRTSGSERMRVTQDNKLLWNLTSSDVGSGTIISGGSINVVTATTNSSLVGMFAVAATRVGIASSHSGVGSDLPFAIDVAGSERMRILTSGAFLINQTSDNGTGSILQVNGGSDYKGASEWLDDSGHVVDVVNIVGSGASAYGLMQVQNDGATHYVRITANASGNPAVVVDGNVGITGETVVTSGGTRNIRGGIITL